MIPISTCSKEIKLKILHKFVHEGNISEQDLDMILEVLFVHFSYVRNYTRGPGAIELLDEFQAARR